MKKSQCKLLLIIILLIIVSCDEPETVVTDIIHPDGSLTRKIEMRKPENKFEIKDIQVPLDSTWLFSDSCEISVKGDTVWVLRAEKDFINVDELNLSYKNDTGCNSNLERHAKFSRSFRWFNTVYRFSETIGKRMKYGLPVSDFMNKEELLWFYTPQSETEARLNGPDSLKYKSLQDSVELKKDIWIYRCIVSEWIGEFSLQVHQGPGGGLSFDSLKRNEERITEIIRSNENNIDSLWDSGDILKEFIGESYAVKFRPEADSAMKIIEDRISEEFTGYSLMISMPGKLTASNGFTDNSHRLVWTVIDEYSFGEDNEMWAESRVPNRWAWVVSGLFVLFVIIGVVIRKNKKG